MKLLNARQMQELERYAMRHTRIPSLILMENAGRGVVETMQRHLGTCTGSFCPLFIGPGNNGGDGLVIGRHLHLRGCQPIFFLLQDNDKLTEDARTNLEIVQACGLPCHTLSTEADLQKITNYLVPLQEQGFYCHAIVDAIFGIGLARKLAGHYKEAVSTINRLSCQLEQNRKIPVIAVDIASGVNADSGQIMGGAVAADYTVTFGYAKPGHFIAGGKAAAGRLDIVDIGIPLTCSDTKDNRLQLIDRQGILPAADRLRRHAASHKGSHGHILIAAGATGSTGAAILAARGALRAGAGLVTLLSTRQNDPILQTSVPEAMTLPLATSDNFLSGNDWLQLKENLARYSAIVLGPGLGIHPETKELVLRIFHETEIPVVVDADALNILALSKERLHHPRGARIYTPHPGEMGRLLNCTVTEIVADPVAAVEKAYHIFAGKRQPAIMVLKGAGTIVYDGSEVFINPTGNPVMATGGMGDVLSGVIAALSGQALSPVMAACCGVYLHGLAADILEQKRGVGGYASEVADNIPASRKQLLQRLRNEPDFG